MAESDEIQYEVVGDDLQFLRVTLAPGRAVVAESGAMMYMEDGVTMETIFGDGSAASSGGGVMGALLGAGKRLLTGESLFMTLFANPQSVTRRVAFAAPYPGKIIPVRLAEVGGELVAQKEAFLVATRGVSVGIAFQRRLGTGLFGGEGFIMERLAGGGTAFLHAGGTIETRDLVAGELLRVDTGCLVALAPSVRYDIELVRGVKSWLFGGEGLFFATLTGPGRVWLQSLPFSRLAGRIFAAAPQQGGSKEEGSLLGRLGNLIEGNQ